MADATRSRLAHEKPDRPARAPATATHETRPALAAVDAAEAGHPGSVSSSILPRLGLGQPLDSTAARIGAMYGQPLHQVRIHTDSSAARVVEQQGARAITIGSHIAFAPGQYQPGSVYGDALLAHELAHVAQQARAPQAPVGDRDEDAPALEADANRAAFGAIAHLHGGATPLLRGVAPVAPSRASRLTLQRCDGGGSAQTALPQARSIESEIARLDQHMSAVERSARDAGMSDADIDTLLRNRYRQFTNDVQTHQGNPALLAQDYAAVLRDIPQLRLRHRAETLREQLQQAGVASGQINAQFRNPRNAHVMSTAYNIHRSNITIEQIRARLGGNAQDQAAYSDQDGNVWYRTGWSTEQTRSNASALYRTASGEESMTFALEGYPPGDRRRLPNDDSVPMSQHVRGLAVDVGGIDWTHRIFQDDAGGPWGGRFSAWSTSATTIVGAAGLHRPFTPAAAAQGTAGAAEHWHFELPPGDTSTAVMPTGWLVQYGQQVAPITPETRVNVTDPVDRTVSRQTGVAWARHPSGALCLTLIRVVNSSLGGGSMIYFESFIDQQFRDPAITRAQRFQPRGIQTIEWRYIQGIPADAPATAARS